MSGGIAAAVTPLASAGFFAHLHDADTKNCES
jgi:hypothetical protein